jgi:DNA-binding MarR family transcriptional regulator
MTEHKPAPRDFPRAAPSGRNSLPDHLPRWLEAVNRRLAAELGQQRARLEFPDLRGSHRRILQMIPPQGIRITDLAQLAGMTKQSLGEFVDGLEQAGYVASRRHESDGRVRIVTRTQSGDAVTAAALEAVDYVEQKWRDEVGADRYDAMMAVLRDLGRDALRY